MGQDANPRLPNFFVVGAGKTGTTSLFHYLRQHPLIYMSPIKEPSYFASEVRAENLDASFLKNLKRMSRNLPAVLNQATPLSMEWLVSEWKDYLRLFQDVRGETAIGEASAAYLWSETAATRIAERVPDARIVMILRDPSERAFSQYLHQLSSGLTRSTFREHLEVCRGSPSGKLSVHYPLLEVGLYYEQVRRYLNNFARSNIQIFWYEEAWRDPHRLLSDLFRFLGVDASFRPDTSKKSLARRTPRFPALNHILKRLDIVHDLSRVVPERVRLPVRNLLFCPGRRLSMKKEDRQYLVDYYRGDIYKLSALLGRDLSAWLR
jgi:hypothetical protein